MHKNINEQGNKNEERKETVNRKQGNFSPKLNFNPYLESDPSDRYDTDSLSKYPDFGDGVASFDKTTVQFLHKLHFPINVLRFFFG